ncbi:uncharacterized protein LOC102899311 isoform X3 [Felis catus]|uniref:uncharacterized protein LOC102899311 isoform X3 n=1 Tax=Felis catus TaxID=9685 RepID=UPI001D1A008F|nr:uncharacterized protein LOC102899311 isoform X3 [Felis catus]XP_044910330.1 uncharacterized protein LOC102899311 isoform X3 [Felis catus]
MPVWTLGTHRSRGNGTYLWGRHSASRSMVKTSSPFLDSTTVHQPASRPLRCLTPPGLTGEREDEKVGRQVQISLTRLQSLARVVLNPTTGVLIRGRRGEDANYREGHGHVKTEIKEATSQGMSKAIRSWKGQFCRRMLVTVIQGTPSSCVSCWLL